MCLDHRAVEVQSRTVPLDGPVVVATLLGDLRSAKLSSCFDGLVRFAGEQAREGRLGLVQPRRIANARAQCRAFPLDLARRRAKPGEVSLSHLGVLFLDELPEFQRGALEALRQPLETGRVTVARANAHVTYPARIQLVAAMNPCRCGYLDNPAEACSRAPQCARDYQSKISGPLFDRIDLHVDVPAVNPADLDLPPPAENSADIRARIARARETQRKRYAKLNGDAPLRTNADADGKLLDEVAAPDEAGRKLLVDASGRLGLSARGFHRVLRVARTLADLDGAGPGDRGLSRIHIAEALSYRRIVPGKSAILMGLEEGAA